MHLDTIIFFNFSESKILHWIKFSVLKTNMKNKNAFQWDAYRPRVDRISQHALRRGGVSALGGICSWGGIWSWGVSAPGGVSAPRGGLFPGGVPGPGGTWSGTPPPPVDRHTPVNILPCPKLRLRAVKILEKSGNFVSPEKWEPCFQLPFCTLHNLLQVNNVQYFSIFTLYTLLLLHYISRNVETYLKHNLFVSSDLILLL